MILMLLNMKKVTITLILMSIVLSVIFQVNAYLVENYFSYLENDVFYYAVAWNAFWTLVVGFFSFKFIRHYSMMYPWIFFIVPFFNVFILGALIGDFDDNIKNVIENLGVILFFACVQGIFIVLGGCLGMSFFRQDCISNERH